MIRPLRIGLTFTAAILASAVLIAGWPILTAFRSNGTWQRQQGA